MPFEQFSVVQILEAAQMEHLFSLPMATGGADSADNRYLAITSVW